MTDLDEMDEKILQVLERDGRISATALAERVGLSASACHRRIAALERDGVIAGYRAVVDPGRRGIGFVAYVTVGLSEHTSAAQDVFERAMRAAPEVREVHNVTGTVEYLLRVEAKDLPAYKRFHAEHLGTVPHVVAITTYVVMSTPKDARA